MSDAGQAFLRMIMDIIEKQDTDRSAALVVHLATLTLLIDAGLVSIEGAVERIEHIHSTLSDLHQGESTKRQVEGITSWLLAHKPADAPRWTPQVVEGGLADPHAQPPPGDQD